MQNEQFAIRKKLSEYNLTQVWLRSELEETGVITDRTELCSVLRGSRRGLKAERIISESVKILAKYEKGYKNAS